MIFMKKTYLSTIKEIFLFSIPLIAGQVGQMLFGIGDIIVAGRYSNDVVAALGVANGLLAPLLMFGLGITFAVGPLTSQFRGKNEKDKSIFANAHYLMLTVSVGLLVAIGALIVALPLFNFNPTITPLIKDYILIAGPSIIPAILFQISKEYLQAWDKNIFSNSLILFFNVINVGMNYIFIFGEFGFPEMGIKGAALATLISRTLMFGALFIYTKAKFEIDWNFNQVLFKRIYKFGIPIGLGTLSEVLMFSAVTVLIGKMSIIASASHNIVINLASCTFMIPLAISSAASVKVGKEYGAGSQQGILIYSLSSIIMVAIIMIGTCAMYLSFPDILVRFATDDPELISYSAGLLLYVGLFQIPDGIQVTLWGILRGLEETKHPMILSLIFNWCIGIPIGYWLATSKGMEAAGLWAGLAIGLTIMSVGLSCVFFFKFRVVKSTLVPMA
ncbi:putative multidrug resistance protein NorM (Na(+)/drug antiporter) [Halobacteriovorax marinus SJ]|uniref:Multidrug-efflux transporter n=2 Tax=Halobacteriovorax marinus TaxID=97084 RepID=E1WZM5_HALMS|nr:putative multidrug resistance protein NorM (Na(+)/drug antiporter) [Halobacteriovorax marinus SJ]